MKFTLPFVKRGQRFSAEVIETRQDLVCIVNLNGDLLRIKNSTGRVFSPGESIQLEVTGIHPLSFKIVTNFAPHLNKHI